MNPKLNGWANYYRHCVAKRTFAYIGHQLFQALWQFHGWQKILEMDCQYNLVQIALIPIKRHVKIKSMATPYDPEFTDYLSKRAQSKGSRNTWSEPVLQPL